MRGERDRPPDRTKGGLDTVRHVVPLVRRWLAGGVSLPNLRSAVRVRRIDELTGGLKSPGVADLTVSVRAIVKQGTAELFDHQLLMNEVNRRTASEARPRQDAVFPEVMRVERVDGLAADRDHVMIQQALVDYLSAHELLYGGRCGAATLGRAVAAGAARLADIHSLSLPDDGPLRKLPKQRDPFSKRLRSRLEALRPSVDWLDAGFTRPMRVDGLELPPLAGLLRRVRSWQRGRAVPSRLSLLHGDPHLANLMVRRRGPRANSVRWIDPNPLVGISDPAYDWGKFMHFVEPTGWAKRSADAVTTRAVLRRAKVTVISAWTPTSPGIERTRQELERAVRQQAVAALVSMVEGEAALELAIASAHIGFAIVQDPASRPEGERRAAERRLRFGVAMTLRALARWHAATR